MSTADSKLTLLGLSAISPPETLRKTTRFASPEEYTGFLREALLDSDDFWYRAALDISWSTSPVGAGTSGDWFPHGKLNLAGACLGSRGSTGSKEAEAFWSASSNGPSRTFSRAQLFKITADVAAKMLPWKLEPGERVLICLPAGEAMVAAVLACTGLGLVCVPVGRNRGAGELAHRFRAASCRAAIFDAEDERAEQVVAGAPHLKLPRVLEPSDSSEEVSFEPLSPMHPAFILADSTGELFQIPTGGFLVQAASAHRYLLGGENKTERLWVANPPHHVSHLAALLGALARGAQVGVYDAEETLDSASLAKLPQTLSASALMISAHLAMRVTAEAAECEQAPGPKLLIVEGETLEPRAHSFLREKIFSGPPHVVQVLSRPESGGFVAGPHPAITPVRPSSVAQAAPGFDIAVIEQDGEECPANYGGILGLRRATPGLARELQGIHPPIPLGVKARRDRSGQLWTMGEAKLTPGHRHAVGTAELEALIAESEGVDQVAVVRLQQGGASSGFMAFVKPGQGAKVDVDALGRQIAERFGEDAVPSGFQIVDKLPYSRSGKLLRSVLRRVSAGEPIGLDDARLITDPKIVEQLTKNHK